MGNAEIGTRVQKRRDEMGMTQEQLAEILKVSRGKVAKMETGEREIKAVDIAEIARALHTDCDYLINGTATQNIDICKETNLSNEAVNILRSWKNPTDETRIVSFATMLTALETLITIPAGNVLLFDIGNYLLNDTSKTFVWNDGKAEMVEAPSFTRVSNGDSYNHLTAELLDEAFLEIQKKHLKTLKNRLTGGQHEQKTER